jgi:hypothetical protein
VTARAFSSKTTTARSSGFSFSDSTAAATAAIAMFSPDIDNEVSTIITT